MPLEDVIGILRRTLWENAEVFKGIDFENPALGMLALAEKLGDG